jgi:hypothetical protein
VLLSNSLIDMREGLADCIGLLFELAFIVWPGSR